MFHGDGKLSHLSCEIDGITLNRFCLLQVLLHQPVS